MSDFDDLEELRASGKFPYLKDADTVIVVSDKRSFYLHSVTLKQSSGKFAQLLEQASAVTADNDGIRYYVVLQNADAVTGAEVEPEFHRVHLDSEGEPIDPFCLMYEDEEPNVELRLYDYYAKILGSFYGIEFTSNANTMKVAMDEALGLIACAEYLDCVPMIAKSVDINLLSIGQRLYETIANSPLEWINLGYRLSSKIIFKEAAIHVVGMYHHLRQTVVMDKHGNKQSELDRLRAPIRELIETKHVQLQIMCQEVEQKLVSYYPPYLQRESVTDLANRDDIGRASYGTNVFAWMALSLFRHWISQNITGRETHEARDGGYKFYKRVNKGGMAYLDREAVARFHTMFPMSRKAKTVLMNHLEVLKDQGRLFTEPLMVNETNLRTEDIKIGRLLCVRISPQDYPW